MSRIYLDNSSTSFPKAPGVAQSVAFFIENVGCNIGRGGYSEAYNAAMVVHDTRERLASMAGFEDPKNVIFTSNITTSLNFLIKGYLKSGDHVLVSSMEHNAMMRPLVQMQERGVSFSRIPCDNNGMLILDEIEPLIKENTKAIFMLHASNVCGTIMPITNVGKICKNHGLRFIVDSAQTFGVVPLNMESMNIDALCFTGHKSLLAPQGIGGFIINDSLALEVDCLISGGTGSKSDSEDVPNFLPDKFESGTMNIPAIYGLNTALKYIEQSNQQNMLLHEQEMSAYFQNGIEKLDGVRIVGEQDPYKRCPIVAVDFTKHDNAQIAFTLESEYGIMTRCGLHCAPNAHKTLGTFPQGIVRFSMGYATSKKEIDHAISSIKRVLFG